MSVMNFKTTNLNIVIPANANNPSILNPDFLKINNIIAKDVNFIEFISTPPFSQIKYEDKTSIIVDTEKLNFSDSNSEKLPDESPIPQIAIKYISTLKYVPYTAVGINFHCIYDFSHMPPTQFILNRFINREIWKEFHENDTIGLKFAFNKANVTHNLEINPSTVTEKKTNKKYPAIFVKSNFHCIPKDDILGDIKVYIEQWKDRLQELKETLEKFFF